MRLPICGRGRIHRRKRFSNSHIRKIDKNGHERSAPQPATVLKKLHRRGSPVTLLNTSGTWPTACSPGSPSAAPATFPAGNCGGQVRLTMHNPFPCRRLPAALRRPKRSSFEIGSRTSSADASKLPKYPKNATFRPLRAPAVRCCDRLAATAAHRRHEWPAPPRHFAVAASENTTGLVAFQRGIAEDQTQRSLSSQN